MSQPEVPKSGHAPVSVVIPLHNSADYISQALDSIGKQSVQVEEIIVVDDGSTDGGGKVAEAHSLQPTVISQTNAGPSAARNRGVLAANSKYVAFIDSDDVWHQEKIQRQLSVFDEQPDLDLCYARIDFFWENPDCEEAKNFAGHPRTNRVAGYIFPTLLARRDVFDRIGLIDETQKFSDAADWTTRAMDAGLNIKLMDDVLLYHRMHEGNLTRKREASSKEFLSFLKQRLDKKRRDSA